MDTRLDLQSRCSALPHVLETQVIVETSSYILMMPLTAAAAAAAATATNTTAN